MSEDVFSRLVSLCDELVNVVLDCPVMQRAEPATGQTSAGRFIDLLQWLHYEEWLTEQVKLYEAKRAVLKAGDGGDDEQDNSEHRDQTLFQDIVQLQEETFTRASQLNTTRHLAKRLLEAKSVHALAFRPPVERAESELDYAATLLRGSLAKQRQLVELTAQLSAVDAKIAETELANADLKQANRQLAAQYLPYAFEDARQLARPDNAAELLARVNHKVDQCIVLHNVLKQLVFESGVNWAADETLRALVLADEPKHEI